MLSTILSRGRTIGLKHVYIALLVLRLCFALGGPGYIHPDEHFQNGEIISARQLGVFNAPTWEWDPKFACRSIIPPAISTGIPYTMVLRLIWWEPDDARPYTMFLVERLAFFFASLVLDRSIYKLVPNRAERMPALILLSSSYVMHTFQIRPFSNAIEAILVAASLRASKSLVHDDWNWTLAFSPDLVSLAVFTVLGVFTRPTFLAFALPILLQAFMWTVHRASEISTGKPSIAFAKAWLRLIGMPLAVASLYAMSITFIDTLFFRGNLYGLTLTPLNWLKYNMSSSNLAEHGVHPRWLHLLVNLPLVVGPGLLYHGIRAARELWKQPAAPVLLEKSRQQTSQTRQPVVWKMPLYVIISSVGILSAFRHQEPRFLVPLLVPFISLISQGAQIRCLGKSFWVTWFLSNAVLATIFGVLHQGGVVPSLISLHNDLGALKRETPTEFNGTLASVVYWKTYMPPWHLLAVSAQDVASGKYVLSDLKGVPTVKMLEHIVSTSAQETFIVTPLHALNDVPKEQRACFEQKERIFPHLDLDHVPEARALGRKDGMSLGIFTVNVACLHPRGSSIDGGVVD
ncbi:glycosyltransferase family 22 protein [Daedalea quercina L-15889]|uniref:Mannosyltransferase n=1 Tax=Daedalea quercina L-15889 TaxID=1314783 RepID=A0A165RX61_9APHY|nr:glycosyltransferase family 22 protein [Daedalea quercina L-15889]